MRTWILASVGALSLVACGDGGDNANDGNELQAVAEREAACVTAADCCVVVDGCLATAYVVPLGDYEEALALANEPRTACLDCISPVVEVRCEAGACVGVEIEDFESPAYRANEGDHCGAAVGDGQALTSADALRAASAPGRTFGCGAD